MVEGLRLPHLLVGHLYCPIDLKTLGNIHHTVSFLNDCSGLGCGIVASSRDNFLGEFQKTRQPQLDGGSNMCLNNSIYRYTVYH